MGVHTLRHPEPTVKMACKPYEASWDWSKECDSDSTRDSDNDIWTGEQSRQAERKAGDEKECAMDRDAKQSWKRRRVLRHLSRPRMSEPRNTTHWQTNVLRQVRHPRKDGRRKKKYRRRDRNIREAKERSRRTYSSVKRRRQRCVRELMTSLRFWTCPKSQLMSHAQHSWLDRIPLPPPHSAHPPTISLARWYSLRSAPWRTVLSTG